MIRNWRWLREREGLHYLFQAASKSVLGPTHRAVDFNKVVLFCFYYGADVYVMSKRSYLYISFYNTADITGSTICKKNTYKYIYTVCLK